MSLDADILAKLLLLQSVAAQFNRDADVLAFVCRGLGDLPGVTGVRWTPAADGPPPEAQQWFPLRVDGCHHGYLVVEVGDEAKFLPWKAHLGNLCFSVAMMLEAWRQRRLNEAHQADLERVVAERTEQLTAEVAERRALERIAREEWLRAERYLEVSEAIIVELDIEGRVETINPRGCDLLGYSAEELVGQSWFEWAMPASIREDTRAVFARVMAGERDLVKHHESLVVDRRGEERWVSWRNTLRKDEAGRIQGTLSSGIDVSDMRRLIESVHRTEKLESLGVLAGGIAHDFNNLLVGLFGFIDLARDELDPSSESAACLDEALDAFERARSLTQELLTFARGGAPIREVGPVVSVLRNAVTFALAGTSVAATYTLPEALWDCDFDPHQLARVFDNLARNAVEAMSGRGYLYIEGTNAEVRSVAEVADVDSTLAPGPYVKLRFEDTGPGVEPAVVARVFDPFFTTKSAGSGLGLAACYSIMRRHGGTVVAEAAPGHGAIFTVWVPAARQVLAAPAGSAVVALPRARGVVLVMDDEPVTRKVLQGMLVKLGYEVVVTEDGAAAVEACREARRQGRVIDALLLDLTVRVGLGGRDVVRDLKDLFPGALALASSGYSEDPVMAAPTAFGFDGALPKPFRVQALASLLQAPRHS